MGDVVCGWPGHFVNIVEQKLSYSLGKEDMARNQTTTEMAEDRKHWHVMIQAGTLRSVEADR